MTEILKGQHYEYENYHNGIDAVCIGAIFC